MKEESRAAGRDDSNRLSCSALYSQRAHSEPQRLKDGFVDFLTLTVCDFKELPVAVIFPSACEVFSPFDSPVRMFLFLVWKSFFFVFPSQLFHYWAVVEEFPLRWLVDLQHQQQQSSKSESVGFVRATRESPERRQDANYCCFGSVWASWAQQNNVSKKFRRKFILN